MTNLYLYRIIAIAAPFVLVFPSMTYFESDITLLLGLVPYYLAFTVWRDQWFLEISSDNEDSNEIAWGTALALSGVLSLTTVITKDPPTFLLTGAGLLIFLVFGTIYFGNKKAKSLKEDSS